MAKLHTGTVTFLFTDIAGSTKLLKQLGAERYGELLADQRRILRSTFEQYNGSEIDTQGDSFFVSFPRATQAIAAVVEIQRALIVHDWPNGLEVPLRMGLHTGEPLVAGEGYVGMDVHRAARIAHAGHGGQVLLSETTTALVKGDLPAGVELLDLGRHRLKDIQEPEHIRQLVIDGLPSQFPPLKSLEMLPPAISLDVGEIKLPDFLQAEVEGTPPPLFVGRQRELARLAGYLDRAQAGQGGVVFITGGPGRGKTALMLAFARQVMQKHLDLLVAAGKCNAYTGAGDPYHPFREVLGDLSGDVEAKWAAGAISSDHAKRLWQVLPETAQAIVDHGPDLAGVFISGQSLLERISSAVPEQRRLLQSLRSMNERERATPVELEQKALFKQYLNVLCQLASKRPILIMLDDLQWADSASLNLLFHLGREIPGGRILVVGAYRPEEVALGRAGERHPLEEILAEFKRKYGDAWIDLSQTEAQEGGRFVDDFVDSQSNHLGRTFREALLAHTEGHPLFTVELLREMQARGDLVRDEDGYWIEGEALNWDLLPARVEGVIEARIGRLQEELREILTIASVEGEDFTAQVIARVKEASERGLVRQLSGELDKVHRLVKEQGTRKVADHRLFLYRFQHQLFQKFLYNGLGEYEREMLHAEVGTVLEDLYEESSEEVASQLAWHFGEAGEVDKAIQYALVAGDRSRRIYAYQEAIDFYKQAIGHLKAQGDDERAARTLMKLGLTYHAIFDFQRSRLAYDEAFNFRQQAVTILPADLQPAAHPFRTQIVSEPRTLDPTISYDNQSDFCVSNIFSGLVELNKELEILPDVARSWEVSEDGRCYRFYLRDDTTWSDGKPVIAADFEYAWKHTLDPENDGPQDKASLYYDIKGARAYHLGEISDPEQVGVRVMDDFTLEVELEQATSYFLYLLTMLYPIPFHVVESLGDVWTEPGHIVSNGPFLLDSYIPGESITLIRNPDYKGHFPGNLMSVDVKFNISELEALERYELNDFDFVGLGPETYNARHHHVEEYISEPLPSTSYVKFNTTCPPFNNLWVRQAFVLTVDRERLAGKGWAALDVPASGGFLPPGMPGHSAGIALPYDPDQARQILAQAGYPNGQGLPKIQLGAWRNVEMDAEYLSAQWRQNLGVEIVLEVMDWKEFLKRKHSTNLDLWRWEADYPDPDNFLRVGVQSTIPYWQNDKYSRLLENARRSTDQNERIRLYQAADKILIDQAVIMPTSYERAHRLVKPWAKDTRLRGYVLPLKDVILEPH